MLHKLGCAAFVAVALMAGCGSSPPPTTQNPSPSPSPTVTPDPLKPELRPRLTVGASQGALRSNNHQLTVLVGGSLRPTDARSAQHHLTPAIDR